MEEHQLRVIDEYERLSEKLGSLMTFMSTEVYKNLATEDQNLMHVQGQFMTGYLNVLRMRIEKF